LPLIILQKNFISLPFFTPQNNLDYVLDKEVIKYKWK